MKTEKRLFYGFRYFSGRHTTCDDEGHIAGELKVFFSSKEREKWIFQEKLSAPCGCDGGERVGVPRKKAISLVGVSEFTQVREWAIQENEEE